MMMTSRMITIWAAPRRRVMSLLGELPRAQMSVASKLKKVPGARRILAAIGLSLVD